MNSNWNIILVIAIIFSLSANNSARSQNFYGEKGYGRLTIVDDSTIKAYFLDNSIHGDGFHNIISYYKSGDTLFLNSGHLPNYTFDSLRTTGITFPPTNGSVPVIMKVFGRTDELDTSTFGCYWVNEGCDYYLEYENIAYFEKESKTVIGEIHDPTKSHIAVFKLYGYFIRAYIPKQREEYNLKEHFYASIDFSGSFKNSGKVTFDKFPLLLKNGSLYPIDKEKNFQCWIDNGFYFPIMHQSEGKRHYEYMTLEWNIGLHGLKGLYLFQLQRKPLFLNHEDNP